MPNADQLVFKDKFIERYSSLTDIGEFKKYSLSFLRKSIRVNTIKMPVPTLKKRLEDAWTLTPVPWCKEGFWISGARRDFGNLPEHVLGYIYVQDAASMIPPLVLDPQPGDIVLDLCSAPGSKATQIGQYMKNEGVLIANDIDSTRLASLGINIQRCGLTNAVITLMQGHSFKHTTLEFDRILVDAPCSGTGTIRKSVKTLMMWNPDMVRRIAGTQRSLLTTAFDRLKEGGTLVYSTCTLEPEENEAVVSHLLSQHENASLENISLDIKRSPPVAEFGGVAYDPDVKKCLRIWPQDNDTEGFFVAKVRKE
ncbi:RsmB/NOP family class I SAM-dependent RNA methyltransferase [Candidatus Woesearchaeota archaeon]|nr:RsmB/NOP family class I SAM-dependent RNA methyltransferase [Candidatus Woesearchaeota archaeon]